MRTKLKTAQIANTNKRYVTWKVRWILNKPKIYEAAWARHYALCRLGDIIHKNIDRNTLSHMCGCVEIVAKQMGYLHLGSVAE